MHINTKILNHIRKAQVSDQQISDQRNNQDLNYRRKAHKLMDSVKK